MNFNFSIQSLGMQTLFEELKLFEEMNKGQNPGDILENWEENLIVSRAFHGHSVSSQFDNFLSRNRIRVIFPFTGKGFDDYAGEFMKISSYAGTLKIKVNNPAYIAMSTGILSGLLTGISERFEGSPMNYVKVVAAGIAGSMAISLLAYSIKNTSIESAREEMKYVDSAIEVYRKGC